MDTADGLDSNCYALPLDADGPTNETCSRDAVAWVALPSGTRRYLCPDHVDVVERFGPVELGCRVRVCGRCLQETPDNYANYVDHEWVCDDCNDRR